MSTKDKEITTKSGNVLRVHLRFDDECKNGHKTFAITGELYAKKPLTEHNLISCGCLHDTIKDLAPEFNECIPYHLVSEDGPMHYIANTLYFIETGNFDAARVSAVWPEASDEELKAATKQTLIDRLPQVMEGFYKMLNKFELN